MESETLCFYFSLILDESELSENYTNENIVSGCPFTWSEEESPYPSLNFAVENLDLNALGEVEEFIDISFNGAYILSGDSVWREMTAELHKLRDE